MKIVRRVDWIALALTLVPVVSACAGASPGPSQGPASGTEASPTGLSDAEAAELEAVFRARRAEALENVHPADVEFVAGMIGHHAQALTMSGYAPDAGGSASVQTLAARIINAQRDEIANMQRWLADRDLPVPQVAADGTVTPASGSESGGGMDHGEMDHGVAGRGDMDHGGMDHEGMPGMLSPEQQSTALQVVDHLVFCPRP